MENGTSLRQADSTVKVIGLLSEKSFEEVVEQGQKILRGSLTIQTSDTNFVTVQMYAKERTKAGTENKIFKAIRTIDSNYKTVSTYGADEADIVEITSGTLNPYTTVKNGQKNERISYRTNFVNRAKSRDCNFTATVETEMFISSIVRETYKYGENKGEETGRLVIRGWMPQYKNGIEPVEFIAPAEDGIADAIESEYTPNMTVKVYANIVNEKVVKHIEEPVKIGKPKIKTVTTYTNAMVITGMSESYAESFEAGTSKVEPYDREAIKRAINEREIKLNEKESKNNTTTSAPTNAPSSGRRMGW